MGNSTIDCAGNIAHFTENRASKSSTCSLIFVPVIKKVYQGNILFVKTIHIMYVFIKGIIGKTNWYVHFFLPSVLR